MQTILVGLYRKISITQDIEREKNSNGTRGIENWNQIDLEVMERTLNVLGCVN